MWTCMMSFSAQTVMLVYNEKSWNVSHENAISSGEVKIATDEIYIFSLHSMIKWFLFDLILYVPSTNFQLNRDESSLVEPVLS